MVELCNKYINVNTKGKWLVAVFLDLIKDDDNIPDPL